MLGQLPRGYERAGALPIVFLLHGSTATGAEMLRESGLEATAAKHGFILAAPDAGIPVGRGFVWNIPGVPTVAGTIPTKDNPDDVAYLSAALYWLAAQGCADDARAYAHGLWGGGRIRSLMGWVAGARV